MAAERKKSHERAREKKTWAMFQIQFEHSFHPVPMGVISLLSSSIQIRILVPRRFPDFGSRENEDGKNELKTLDLG